MYLLNLFIGIIVTPILVYRNIGRINTLLSIRFIFITFAVGIFHWFLSTLFLISLRINILDAILMHLFFASIYGIIYWIYLKYRISSATLKGIIQFITAILIGWIFIFSYGPAESTGKRISSQTFSLPNNIKVTYAGFQAGFMDYGSQFLIYETDSFGFEKIIGSAINNIFYYGNDVEIDCDLKNHTIMVHYIYYDGNKKSDELFIKQYP